MATFRGSDGALQYNSNAVGEIQSWELSVDRPELETTAMADTSAEFTLDIPNWSGTATVNFDYSDTAQAAIVAQVIAGTVASAVTAQFRVSSTKYLSGSVLVRSASVSSQRGSIVTATLQLRGTGALTATWS